MPLVVPGINNTLGDKTEWLNKLAGKKISESTGISDVNTFAKTDLPENHRVLKPDSAMTMDHRPDRLNVLVNDEGIVHDVNFG